MSVKFVAKVDVLNEKSIISARKAFVNKQLIVSSDPIDVELYVRGPSYFDSDFFKNYYKHFAKAREKYALRPIAVHNPSTALNGKPFSFTANPEFTLESAIQAFIFSDSIGAKFFNVHPFGPHRGTITHAQGQEIALKHFKLFLDRTAELKSKVRVLPEADGADPFIAVKPPYNRLPTDKRFKEFYYGELPDQLQIIRKEICPSTGSMLIDVEHTRKGLASYNINDQINILKQVILDIEVPLVHVCQHDSSTLWSMTRRLYERANKSDIVQALEIYRMMNILDTLFIHIPATGKTYEAYPANDLNRKVIVDVKSELPDVLSRNFFQIKGDILLKSYFELFKEDYYVVLENHSEHTYKNNGWDVRSAGSVIDDAQELSDAIDNLKNIVLS